MMKMKGLGIQDAKKGEKSKQTTLKEIDYLNQIPREVLYHILSFLPFEYWIIMGMVSKQWQNLFCESPVLSLNEIKMVSEMTKQNLSCGLHHHHHHTNLKEIKKDKRRFAEFVNYIISSHSGCFIRDIVLSFQYEPRIDSASNVNNWIHFLMTRDIERLDLNFSAISEVHYEHQGLATWHVDTTPFFELPSQPFEPKFRTFILKLCKLKVSRFGSFMHLKVLYLIDVIILDQSIGQLLSKCPVIENLYLKRCSVVDNFFICRRDLKIKYMALLDCFAADWKMYKLDLSVPKLTNFVITGRYLMSSIIRNATSLIVCVIDIDHNLSDNIQGNFLGLFLIGLKHCQTLSLTSWCIQVLSTLDIQLSQQLRGSFKNLKNLRLIIGFVKQELPGIILLLQSCPCLESLTLEIDYSIDIYWFTMDQNMFVRDFPPAFEFEEDEYLLNQFQDIDCLKKSLKVIHIYGDMGEDKVTNLISFILRNAQVLENLIVHKYRFESQFQEWERFIELGKWKDLPKASPLLRISEEIIEVEEYKD